MNCHVDPNYREVSKKHFVELLGDFSWQRDAYADGEYYYAADRPYRPRIAVRYHDGKGW